MRCRNCKQLLVNPHRRPFEVWCSPDCAVAIWRAKEAKKQAQETLKRIEALLTLQQRAKAAEKAVNRYVRLRDVGDGCISCLKGADWGGQWHASHFRSVGAASSIRFNLWNINKACSVCNNYKSGNLSEYEPRLILKIGKDKVEWLKSQNSIRRYDAEYLSRLKQIFNKRANRLSKRLSHA